jgi:hypothetical protein
MNMFSPRCFRWLMLLLLGLGCLPLFAVSAFAADAATTIPILQANFLYDVVADRTRLIQISVVIVAIGCALMWWMK